MSQWFILDLCTKCPSWRIKKVTAEIDTIPIWSSSLLLRPLVYCSALVPQCSSCKNFDHTQNDICMWLIYSVIEFSTARDVSFFSIGAFLHEQVYVYCTHSRILLPTGNTNNVPVWKWQRNVFNDDMFVIQSYLNACRSRLKSMSLIFLQKGLF